LLYKVAQLIEIHLQSFIPAPYDLCSKRDFFIFVGILGIAMPENPLDADFFASKLSFPFVITLNK
jgi:hypothetical protein